MANLRDIKRRIKSVKNTQQITKAMKMVAAAKLRRSQDTILATRPYALELAKVTGKLAEAAQAGIGGPGEGPDGEEEVGAEVLDFSTGDPWEEEDAEAAAAGHPLLQVRSEE